MNRTDFLLPSPEFLVGKLMALVTVLPWPHKSGAITLQLPPLFITIKASVTGRWWLTI
jgi:hypothetical protein